MIVQPAKLRTRNVGLTVAPLRCKPKNTKPKRCGQLAGTKGIRGKGEGEIMDCFHKERLSRAYDSYKIPFP